MTVVGKINQHRLRFHQLVGAFLTCWFLLLLPVAAAATALEEAELDRFVSNAMAAGAVPGVALAIVKGGQVVHGKGYGQTGDGQPFTADTRMLVASLSKAMTAAVVLMLVAEGRIDLDAPVQRYLPDFPYFVLSPLDIWLGLDDPIDARRGHAIVNAYSLAFFDLHVKGAVATLLLNGPIAQYPEVIFERRKERRE